MIHVDANGVVYKSVNGRFYRLTGYVPFLQPRLQWTETNVEEKLLMSFTAEELFNESGEQSLCLSDEPMQSFAD